MSDDDFKKELADLQAKMKDLEGKNSSLSSKLEEQKEAKNDVIKQRDELKTQLKTAEGNKETENATVEQLKELLKEKDDLLTKSESARTTDRIEAKVMEAALKANFVLNKAGKINAKILKSELDISKLHLDDDGEVIGLASKFDKMREESPFLFNKKKAAAAETKVEPKSKKGEDLSQDALDGEKDFHKRREIIRKRGELHTEENKNSLPSGMGENTKAKPAEAET